MTKQWDQTLNETIKLKIQDRDREILKDIMSNIEKLTFLSDWEFGSIASLCYRVFVQKQVNWLHNTRDRVYLVYNRLISDPKVLLQKKLEKGEPITKEDLELL